jgi:hypothetical protein
MSDVHVFADQEDAAERYLLGQMSEADRDAYEQHFFQCVECAEEVKATAQFIDTCRTVLSGPASGASVSAFEPRPSRLPRGLVTVMTGALAATLLVMIYQNVVTIPRLARGAEPQALASISFAASTPRGASPKTITIERWRPFIIYVDIPPTGAESYDCQVLAKSGAAAATMTVAAEKTQDAVPFMIPGGLLSPGDYTLVVTGRSHGVASPAEVARFPFTVRFAD